MSGFKDRCAVGVSLVQAMAPAPPGTLAIWMSSPACVKLDGTYLFPLGPSPEWRIPVVAWVAVASHGDDGNYYANEDYEPLMVWDGMLMTRQQYMEDQPEKERWQLVGFILNGIDTREP